MQCASNWRDCYVEGTSKQLELLPPVGCICVVISLASLFPVPPRQNITTSHNYAALEYSTGAMFDGKTDMWSLGCTVFEMLHARQIFRCVFLRRFGRKTSASTYWMDGYGCCFTKARLRSVALRLRGDFQATCRDYCNEQRPHCPHIHHHINHHYRCHRHYHTSCI